MARGSAWIKSGKYSFAIVDGRNIRISRLGFQRWQKSHTKISRPDQLN